MSEIVAAARRLQERFPIKYAVVARCHWAASYRRDAGLEDKEFDVYLYFTPEGGGFNNWAEGDPGRPEFFKPKLFDTPEEARGAGVTPLWYQLVNPRSRRVISIPTMDPDVQRLVRSVLEGLHHVGK